MEIKANTERIHTVKKNTSNICLYEYNFNMMSLDVYVMEGDMAMARIHKSTINYIMVSFQIE